MDIKKRVQEIETTRTVSDEEAVKFLRNLDALSYFFMLLILGFILDIIVQFIAAPTIVLIIAFAFEAYALKNIAELSEFAYEGLVSLKAYAIIKKVIKNEN